MSLLILVFYSNVQSIITITGSFRWTGYYHGIVPGMKNHFICSINIKFMFQGHYSFSCSIAMSEALSSSLVFADRLALLCIKISATPACPFLQALNSGVH